MIKIKNNKKLLTLSQALLIISTIVILLINPKLNMNSFFEGLSMWARLVMPALFPFIFFTSILCGLGIAKKIGKFLNPITKKLFNCSGASGYVYLLSILSGYPIGAKVTSELYENGTISKHEAHRITSFSSTSGPLFIIGTVGVGMFGSVKLGVIVLISHLTGALLNGIIYRNLYKTTKVSTYALSTNQYEENLLEKCMLSSIKSILVIGGYITLTYMLISIINTYNLLLPITSLLNKIFKIDPHIIKSLLSGMIEITSGTKILSTAHLSFNLNTLLSTAIITMGGLSITLQAYTYLAKFKISMKLYCLQKITHTALSIGVCAIILLFV